MEKLIRQNIVLPASARTRKAHPDELDKLLGRKIVEEADELQRALDTGYTGTMKRGLIVDECVDVIEVVNTIMVRHGIANFQLASAMESKRDARGGFEDRVLIDAPVDDRTAPLRELVEDLLRYVIEQRAGLVAAERRDRIISQLNNRAQLLGCLGTNAKTGP